MCSKCCATFSRKSYGKSHLKMIHQEDNVNLIIDTSINEQEEIEDKNSLHSRTIITKIGQRGCELSFQLGKIFE